MNSPSSSQSPIVEFLRKSLQHSNLVAERYLIPFLAVAGAYIIHERGGTLTPEQGLLLPYVGSAALSTVFAKINQGKPITQEELRDAVEQAFAQHLPQDLLRRSDFSTELLKRTTELGNAIGTALAISDDQIVRRLAQIQDASFAAWVREILDAINQSAGRYNQLDSETKYLIKKISLWEKKQDGILERYVERQCRIATPGISSEAITHEKTRLRHQALSRISIRMTKEQAPIVDADKNSVSEIRQALEHFQRIILLGEPGAGKTTTLLQIAIEAAQKRLANKNAPIPVLLSLADWKAEDQILDFIRSNWELDDLHPQTEIVTGNILLLLDGLNEMPGDRPEKFSRVMEWLQEYNSPKNVILCCRDHAFESLKNLNQLDANLSISQIVLEPLSRNQIVAMASNYLNDQADVFLEKIFPDIRPGLTDTPLGLLARNAFMLAALIYIYEPNRKFPTNPGAIIKLLVETLWERELAMTIKPLAFEEIELPLTNIAYKTLKDDLPQIFTFEFAIAQGLSSELLEMARSASLLETTAEGLSFYHQLFLEYFAAVGLLRSKEVLPIQPTSPKRIREALDANPPANFGKMISIHAIREAANIRWQQPIIMMAGMLEPAHTDRFLNDLLTVEPWTVGMAMAKRISNNQQLFDKTVHALAEAEENIEYIDTHWVFLDMMKSLGKEAIPYIDNLMKQLPRDNQLRGTASEVLLQIDDPSIPYLLEKTFKEAFTTQDDAVLGHSIMNLFIMWDEQNKKVNVLDGYNLRCVTSESLARPSIEFAWQYKPHSSLIVKRLEFWLSNLEAPQLELYIGIRLDNNGRPSSSRLRDPLKVTITSKGYAWQGVDFDPPLELHNELTYWICYKGMIQGAFGFHAVNRPPSRSKAFAPPLADAGYFPEAQKVAVCFTQEVIGQWKGPLKGLPKFRLLG